MKAIDMSPEAIAARLAEVGSLNRLCGSLGEAGRASKTYERQLEETFELDAVPRARGLTLLLKPSHSPELCISLTSDVLTIQTLDRSVWTWWNACAGRPIDPVRSWVRPQRSVESIGVAGVGLEDFMPAAPSATEHGVTLDGARFELTVSGGGSLAHFTGRLTPIAPSEVWRLIDFAMSRVRWEWSKTALTELELYRR